MSRPDAEFHDFVVGFADPLARLAFLLTVGTAGVSSEDSTLDALAQVRRHWHEAEVTGAPEPLAVEALLGSLPSLPTARHIPRLHHSPHNPLVPEVPRARPTADDNAAFRPPTAGGDRHVAAGVDVQSIETSRDELREAIWSVFTQLPPRERVPLLFADLSAASRRLVGLDVPESFGSPRRYELAARTALHDIRAGLGARELTSDIDDDELGEQVTAALRERCSSAPIPVDPYPTVEQRVRGGRRRTAVAVAAVIVLLSAGTVTAAVASNPPKAKPVASGASAHPPLTNGHAALTQPGIVVDWPTRGSVATNAELISALETNFVHSHPDAVGQVQVLLATDTSSFRLAYVNANSAKGVIQSWYYGPVGSTQLSEGTFSYGPELSSDSVIATVLSDADGHTQLVVIGPPSADDIEVASVDTSIEAQRPDFIPVPHSNGLGVQDVSNLVPADLLVSVSRGPITLFRNHAVLGHLVPNDDATAVETGSANPDLLAAAMAAADTWRRTGALGGPATRVALWGGTDAAGIQLVLVRLTTDSLVDGLLVEWVADPDVVDPAERMIPVSRHEEMSPNALDFPLAFSYGVSRVGVVVPSSIATTVLVVDGQDEPPTKVDAHGFASMQVRDQRGLLSEQQLQVDLYDRSGHVAGTLPVADSVP